jgi:hypothetical protein
MLIRGDTDSLTPGIHTIAAALSGDKSNSP